jgi:2'-5' RNA ligase
LQHLGIFIEPISSLKEYIIEAKAFLGKYDKRSPYLDHPPHLTLCHGKFLNEVKVKESIKKILTNKEQITLKTSKINSFKNDQLTGLNTLYVEIVHNEKLCLLQNEIVNNIRPDEHVFLDLFSSNKKINKNLRIYNYPFIYPNWIPHFTIASVGEDVELDFYKSFNKLIKFSNIVEKLSLWEISGVNHFKIEEFEVGL